MNLSRNILRAARPLPVCQQRWLATESMHGTTILCVRKNGRVAMIGDGLVSMGSLKVKHNAKKVRRIGDGVLVGFAGSTADAFTLLERLERKLEEHPGQLMRAAVDLAKAWRTDKYLRRLEAVLLVADNTVTFEITGNGDVLEPADGVMGIGSGGPYALAAARALKDIDGLDADTIAKKALAIAADMCVYTNHNTIIETLELSDDNSSNSASATMNITPPPSTAPDSSKSSSSSSSSSS